ncbi:MAG: site-specific integrase [Oscillospiraceae bacterium]|nr:site-specific integrase [Oscillospiraceae bacterium]
MKAHKHGEKYRITYRCPNYPNLINETFDSEEEANLRIAQIMLEKKRGTLLPPAHLVDPDANPDLARETMTVEQLMTEYVSLYGLNKWSESTLSSNQHRIEHYILPYIGQLPIKPLTTHRLELFYQKLLTEPAVKTKGHEHQNKTITHSVVDKVHSLIRSALNQAIRWDYLRGANPAMTVELPKQKKTKREVWTDQEAFQALALCTDPILKLCLLLALGCSMRIGEILALTWDCVHIEDELIEKDEAYLYVDKELRRCKKSSLEKLRGKGRDEVFFTFPELKQTGCTTSLVLKTPKTESSVRTIYLPATVAESMKAMYDYQLGLKGDLCGEYTDYNLVIAQDNGRPFEERLIALKLKDLISANNLRPVVFHSLRHSSTGLKLKISGGDIKAVQGDTGHAVADMVTNVYSHIVDEDRKTLAKKVDE